MRNPRDVTEVDNWNYACPLYEVTNDGIKEVEEAFLVRFCRGNKDDENLPRHAGIFTETLLQVCLEYLEGVNEGELRNRDTSIAITHIEDALLRLNKRQEGRKLRGVQATYQK